MGRITGVYLMPHPPIILEEIGRGEERKVEKTINAMNKLSQDIQQKKPDTIIVITPHGPVFDDGIGIMAELQLKGDFSKFGMPRLSMSYKNDIALVDSIVKEAGKDEVLCVGIDKPMAASYDIPFSLDWGVMVPLYFIRQLYDDFKLVAMGTSMLPLENLYLFGTAIKRAVESLDGDVVIVASGDLSHRLKEDGPYGYNPAGPKLDNQIMDLLNKGNVEGLLTIHPELIEEGGECGLRSIIIAMGALDGHDFTPTVLSYEGPFGVGYGVASFEPGNKNLHRLLVDNLFNQRDHKIKSIRDLEDAYVRLARESLETYIIEGKTLNTQEGLPHEMLNQQAGVFVSIKAHGQLRGCIGTIEATQSNISQEIIHNAISAGTRDPRFFPVEEEELDELIYSVDVLKEPEPIESICQLDVKRYGVIVNHGRKSGLLLPNLEGVNSPQEQVNIALQKAGINSKEPYTMKRFEVIRHK